jgi:hypothetical protein
VRVGSLFTGYGGIELGLRAADCGRWSPAPPAVLRARQKRVEQRMAAFRSTLAPARPAFPYVVHDFAVRSDLPGLSTQCVDCFGWYDDPRHLTPMPSEPLE